MFNGYTTSQQSGRKPCDLPGCAGLAIAAIHLEGCECGDRELTVRASVLHRSLFDDRIPLLEQLRKDVRIEESDVHSSVERTAAAVPHDRLLDIRDLLVAQALVNVAPGRH